MKDMQRMQREMMKALEEAQQLQQELESEIVEGSAGGGAVRVKATGGLRLTEISIDPSVIDADDPEGLADTVLAAVNNALDNARGLQERKLGALAGGLGGLGLPGM